MSVASGRFSQRSITLRLVDAEERLFLMEQAKEFLNKLEEAPTEPDVFLPVWRSERIPLSTDRDEHTRLCDAAFEVLGSKLAEWLQSQSEGVFESIRGNGGKTQLIVTGLLEAHRWELPSDLLVASGQYGITIVINHPY